MATEDQPRPKKMRYYEDDKFWFMKKAGVITIGITPACLDDLGTVDSVSLPNEGDDFDKNDVLVELSGSNDSVGVYTPAAGFVVEVNTPLETDQASLNEDPDGEGWLVRIEYQDEADLKEFEEG